MNFREIIDGLGDEYSDVKRFLGERKLFDAYLLLKEKNDADSILMKGITLMLLKKNDDALKTFIPLVHSMQSIPGSAGEWQEKRQNVIPEWMLCELIGTLYQQKENMLEALKWYMVSIGLYQDNIIVKNNMASIYLRLKDYKKALGILESIDENKRDEKTNKNIDRLKTMICG
jgi:tetratricopeptide (TPR) repeat protein